jgi:hypothetical protein
MGSLKTEAYEREMKGKKENQTNTKSNIIIIHVPPEKKKKAQTHRMPQQNIFSTTTVIHTRRLKATE